MSLYDDVYSESLHDWLDERKPEDVPSMSELADDFQTFDAAARWLDTAADFTPRDDAPASAADSGDLPF